ncbi:MAG: translocation/assembly module TamB domain-containing protein, partial [Prevotella sp.]|nr:translocation/assembly module TamB domain-containing protein [Prevotella sp.]
MKTIKVLIRSLIWFVAGLYLLTAILLHVPTVQSFIGQRVASAIGEKIGSRCDVGRVDLGFFNRMIVDDVAIYDQSDSLMLRASRLSAKVDVLPLFNGKISISSAQLFGLQGHFYKKNAQTPANYQFALDALASKDTTSHKPLDLHINSLIIRRGSVQYDRYDCQQTPELFNVNHLKFSDISAHVMLPTLTDDNLELLLKKLSLKEQSGLDVENLSFKLTADKQRANLEQLNLRLPDSKLSIDSLTATYQFINGKFDKNTLQYKGRIASSTLTPSSLACFTSFLKPFDDQVHFSAALNGSSRQLAVEGLTLRSFEDAVNLKASATLGNLDATPRWFADIDHLSMSAGAIESIAEKAAKKDVSMPAEATRLGNIHFEGSLGGTGKHLFMEGLLLTDAGDADVGIDYSGDDVDVRLSTDGIDVKRILADDTFGQLATNIQLKAQLNDKNISTLTAKGKVSRFDYKNYSYSNLDIDGTLQGKSFDGTVDMDDENGQLQLSGNIVFDQQHPQVQATASVRHFSPQALHLSDAFGNSVFDADITADIAGPSLETMNGTLAINDFHITKTEPTPTDYHLSSLLLEAQNSSRNQQLHISSDFGNIDMEGRYRYSTILQSLTHLITEKIPNIPGLKSVKNAPGNSFAINADIQDSRWLQALLGIDLNLASPLQLSGFVDDRNEALKLNLKAPRWSFNGSDYANTSVLIDTSSDGELTAEGHLRKEMESGRPLELSLTANASDNHLYSSLQLDNNGLRPILGTLNSTTEFFNNERGEPMAHVRVHNSDVFVNDTIWRVQPADIIYGSNNLLVDYFAIEHDDQHIIISGRASNNPLDSLVADLSNVNVQYILDMVNFTSVSFKGYASGKAVVKTLFGSPDAKASLRVDDFRFQDGRMGTLFAEASYNKTEKQIDIDAHADDENAQTLIKGNVSPARNDIDLDIQARGTRLEFLESFCGSFMDNVEARGRGAVRLHGSLKNLNLTGLVVADGELDITPLGTHYALRNDTIRLGINEIVLHNDTVRDVYGSMGIVEGVLHHDHLRRLTYDIGVSARNLLSYDIPAYGENTFFGKVFATGTCNIRGRSGRIDFDINAVPNRGSFIEYNATSPDAITDQRFITWRESQPPLTVAPTTQLSPTPVAFSPTLSPDNNAPTAQPSHPAPEKPKQENAPSDLFINFLINATPDFTLRVLMDKASGDYIALNGSGTIRASYYNKGSFDMFGTYLVDHGVYKLTIQNVMKRDFQFQTGGTIVFGGNAYDATLNLPAVYTVNGVSLSDLQMGRSFTSNNVRVDCLMNITGTPLSPQVEFDLDLPTVNADAKQMVRQLINSEEEMNQQVIYLLSIGRFYNQGVNNADQQATQSQTSLAMQSLLSGTISQQINTVLSSLVNNSNWNFGANISTGDEGFNNAEYEGLLSGRLLNNRLIINGQ